MIEEARNELILGLVSFPHGHIAGQVEVKNMT